MAIRNKKKVKCLLRSGYEDSVAAKLKQFGVKFEYETLKLRYEIPATQHTYTPDFILPNGIIVETKGYCDSDTFKKMVLVVKQNPELDIRMAFQNPNTKIRKGSATTYAVKCTKLGIKWGDEKDILIWAQEKPKTK